MRSKPICYLLSKHVIAFLVASSFILTACGQNRVMATALGLPSLSQDMINQYSVIYEFLLEIKLTPQQKGRIQKGLIQYWKHNNADAITQTIADLKYYGNTNELQSLRNTSQNIIVEAFRRDANDSVSKVFIEAYDAAHPERISSTKAKGFADLVGNWKRTDGLLAETNYNGQPAGVSYTESESINISADGKFKHIKVHSHYNGACSQVDGKTEYGKIRVEGTKLILEIRSGSEIVKDNCNPSLNQRVNLKPRKECLPWTIKTNPQNNNVQTLCWTASNAIGVCFEKQKQPTE